PGSGARLRASIATYSARVPSRCQSARPNTRWPTDTPVVPYPSAVTTPASSCPGIDGVRSRSRRSVQVEGQAVSVGTNPDAWISTTTSLIAACGSGRSTSFIPAVPAAWSVTTIAFIVRLPLSSPRVDPQVDGTRRPRCRSDRRGGPQRRPPVPRQRQGGEREDGAAEGGSA